MIISRTPYRVSFFGGGTDYPVWFREHGGAVLSTTINRYCYINCRQLPPFFDHKSRIVWSQIENVDDHDAIHHPSIREVLRFLKIDTGVEIHHNGDLPARSGLGSSSAFTVALLHALHSLMGDMVDRATLAREAIHVEQTLMRENVGVQDQIQTAFGGFNRIRIDTAAGFAVEPVTVSESRLTDLRSHLLLFYTGVVRHASKVAESKIKAIPGKQNALRRMLAMVDEALAILSDGDITDFGHLLHEGWTLKRSLSSAVSPPFVDEIYEQARRAGALGGKLLGAGGGGFMVFFVRPEDHFRVLNALSSLMTVPFEFDRTGSQIVYYDPAGYSRSVYTRRDFRRFDGTPPDVAAVGHLPDALS